MNNNTKKSDLRHDFLSGGIIYHPNEESVLNRLKMQIRGYLYINIDS
jgi:hypothetical protein